MNDTSDQQLLRLTNSQADLDQHALENEANMDAPLTLSNLQPSLAAIDGVPSFGNQFAYHNSAQQQASHSPQPQSNHVNYSQSSQYSSVSVSGTNAVFSPHQSSPFSQRPTAQQQQQTSNNNNNTNNSPNGASTSTFSSHGLNQQSSD